MLRFRSLAWIAATTLSSAAPMVSADDWVGPYAGTSFCTRLDGGTGSWHDGSNWYDLTAPLAAGTATFDATFDPEANGMPRRVVFDDLVVRQVGSQCDDYFVGGGSASIAGLRIAAGDFTFDLGGHTLAGGWASVGIGGFDGAIASLSVDGSGTLAFTDVSVGGAGEAGTLAVRNGSRIEGGRLLVSSAFRPGAFGQAEGHLIVEPGATLKLSGELTMGYLAEEFVKAATFDIRGIVDIERPLDANLRGVVISTGSGWIRDEGLVTTTHQVQVGVFGTGSLLVEGASLLRSGEAASPSGSSGIIGLSGGAGDVTIRGPGSRWTQDGGLSAGFDGSGSLEISSEGFVQSLDGFVARFAGSDGTVFLDNDLAGGGRSIWQIDDSFYVGGDRTARGGEAFVEVDRGGVITVGNRMMLWDDGTVDLREGGSIVIGAGEAEPLEDTVVLQGGGSLEGAGALSGNVLVADGTLAPGASPGTLSIDGGAVFGRASAVDIELAGVASGTDHDRIEISGNASLGGVLVVSFLDGFESEARGSDVFAVLDAEGDLSGGFLNAASGARMLTADGLGSFEVWYGAGSPFDPTAVMLTGFRAVPEPGSAGLILLGMGVIRVMARKVGRDVSSPRG